MQNHRTFIKTTARPVGAMFFLAKNYARLLGATDRMRIVLKFVPLLLLLLLTACAPKNISTVVSCNYDKTKNQTDYTVLPLGLVSLPGKWEKKNFYVISKQQFFVNSDSVEIAVAFNRFDGYEFNAKGQYKGWDFVKAFYEWETVYFSNKLGLKNAILTEDRTRNFIIYRVFDGKDRPKVDTYYLIAEKNGNMSNFSVSKTGKWTEEKKVEFLKSLLRTN